MGCRPCAVGMLTIIYRRVILAITSANVDTLPTLFKTYEKSAGFKSCTVWQVLYTVYNDQLKRYEKEQEGLSKMEGFLRWTVAQKNKIHMEGKEQVYEKVKALMEKLEPSDAIQKMLVRNKLKALTMIGTEDPHKWIEKFRTAITEAQRPKLPDIEDAGDLYMFIDAVIPLDPSFAKHESYKLKDKLMANETLPTIESLIASWEHDLRIDKAK